MFGRQHAPCGREPAVAPCQQWRRQQRPGLPPAAAQQQQLPAAALVTHSSSPWLPACNGASRRRQWLQQRHRLPPPAAAGTEQAAAAAEQQQQQQQQQQQPPALRRAGLPPPVERVPQYKMPKEPLSEFGFSKAFSEKYELLHKIGKGASCTVHSGVERATGRQVAVKVMPKRLGPDGFLEKAFARRVRNEVEVARHLRNSLNVCYFYGAYETDAAVQLVMEPLTGGQLWDRVQQGTYTERQVAGIVRDVVRTVAQCHSKNIMMRDIKPQNFMFATPDEDAPLKAVDFGIAVFCKPGQYLTTRAGTRIVMAPEVVRERYTLAADLWSVGVLAYLLLTGRLPFPFWDKMYVQRQAVTERDMYNDICYAPLDFESPPWDTLSVDAKDFVQRLLERDDSRRMTAEEALQHQWLRPEEEQAGGQAPISRTIVQRLQRFGTYGRLRQAALRTVAAVVPQDSTLIAELRGLFMDLDPLDTGRVPYTRLQQELEEGTYDLSPAECQHLLATMELTPEGDITFQEFLASLVDWNKLQATGQWEVLVDRAFDALDQDGCGRIGPADLELLLCGEEGCEAEDWLDAALREADVVHTDRHIDRAEFHRLMHIQIQDKLHLFDLRLSSKAGGSRSGDDSVLGSIAGSSDGNGSGSDSN